MTTEVRPGRGSTRESRLTIAIAAMVGIAAAACGWFRLPAVTRGTLWAEDMPIFLAQRIAEGPWRSLFTPYQGYLHFVPRLLADVGVATAPMGAYAITTTVLSLLVVGAVAATVYVSSATLLSTRFARILLALVPVLVPLAPVEVLGNLANLHTFGLFAVPVLLLARPSSRIGIVGQCVALALITLTEVQSLLFVPVLVLLVRYRRSWPAGVVFLAGLAAQFVAVASSERTPQGQPLAHRDVIISFFVDPVLGTWFPNPEEAARHLVAHGWFLLILAAVPFAIAAGVAVAGPWGRRSTFVAVLAYGAVVVWVADVVSNGPGALAYFERGFGILSTEGYVRYAVPAEMFLLAIVAACVDRLLVLPGLVWRILAYVAAAALVALVVIRFVPSTTTRAEGPLWSVSVEQAEQSCASRSANTIAHIDGAPRGWRLDLRCGDIGSDRRFP